MDADDHVCLCFRVSRAKLEKYVRLHSPAVPSLLSECGGAGTGCGWCIPFLKKIWMRESAGELTAAEYATRRAQYISDGKGTPPQSSNDHNATEGLETRGETPPE
jgi:bacterioferritin-associated ferredoxin